MPCFLLFCPPRVRTWTETPSDSTGPASAFEELGKEGAGGLTT